MMSSEKKYYVFLFIAFIQFIHVYASDANDGLVNNRQRKDKDAGPAHYSDTLSYSDIPAALSLTHFPDKLHAFIWRNWNLLPVEKMAGVLHTKPSQIREIALAMGLPEETGVTGDQLKRSYITIIRRNWHLLPYEQLLELMGWTREYLDFILKEDDFLFAKLGGFKPECEPLFYVAPNNEIKIAESYIREIVEVEFQGGLKDDRFSLFDFPDPLSPLIEKPAVIRPGNKSITRICYSYAALYGDPLLDTTLNPYPDKYLKEIAGCGINGIWLPAILYKLTPFPWDTALSINYKERQRGLLDLVKRARSFGIGVYLYLNEPRSMPLAFFEKFPDLKGVTEGDFTSMCTTNPDVRNYLAGAVTSICREVPGLAGFITITASENLTNCWSHFRGHECKLCSAKTPSEVIAEVNNAFYAGIRMAFEFRDEDSVGKNLTEKEMTPPRLIAWDWAWQAEWEEDAISRLDTCVTFMAVSEWGIPINRGGIKSQVGEYCLSVIGPGERAKKYWQKASDRGMDVFAKIQANITWEISALPYIPVMKNVALHAGNLRDSGIDGVMAGWTLGGYPSPNLEVLSGVLENPDISPDNFLKQTAVNYYGKAADTVMLAWYGFSDAFNEFPFNINVVYRAPLQYGPSNLLWPEPTGYKATMVGLAYDDVNSWRSFYPEEVFITQLKKIVSAFEDNIKLLEEVNQNANLNSVEEKNLEELIRMARVVTIHYQSIINQADFTRERDTLAATDDGKLKKQTARRIREILESEILLAKALFNLQMEDPRIGFEASNQYYYVPTDLVEKVINCRYLLDYWLAEQ